MKIALLVTSLLFSSITLGKEGTLDCPPGTYFVRSHLRSAYQKADGTLVRATHVASSCRHRTKSYEFWHDRLKNGRPDGWPHNSEKSVEWTTEQQERFFDALESLPPIFQIESIKSVYRMKNSWYPPNPGSHAKGLVVFYDTAFAKGKNTARYVAHELAHEIFENLPNDGESYLEAAGWKPQLEGNIIYWVGRETGYVDDDGQTSRSEDFANNVEYYLFEPNKLKKLTPKVFQWLKKNFGDKLVLKEEKK